MKRRWISIITASVLAVSMLAGCGGQQTADTAENAAEESAGEVSETEESGEDNLKKKQGY